QRQANLKRMVNEDLSQNQAARFESLLRSITAGNAPRLWYIHATLPHVPWVFLPDGTSYSGAGVAGLDLETGQWTSDEYVVRLQQQRMLLQLQFTDRLVSALLDRLRATGLGDKALLIVTADHGVAFDKAGYRREPHCSPHNTPVCDAQNMHEI